MSDRSHCPECGTILRIRDRSFVGRRVHCPECRVGLIVIEVEGRDREYSVRKLTAEEAAAIAKTQLAAKSDRIDDPKPSAAVQKSRKKSRGTRPTGIDLSAEPVPGGSRFRQWINSPLTVTWLLAIAVLFLMSVLILAPKYRFSSKPAESANNEQKTNTDSERTLDPVEMTTSEQTPSTEQQTAVVEPVIDQTALVARSALLPENKPDGIVWVPPDAEAIVEPEPIPPPTLKIDVAAKLEQKIVLYQQTKPARRRDLIEAFEEHLGAPIRFDAAELGNAELDKAVTFELKDTTLGEIIKTVAAGAGWDIVVEESGLRLVKK